MFTDTHKSIKKAITFSILVLGLFFMGTVGVAGFAAESSNETEAKINKAGFIRQVANQGSGIALIPDSHASLSDEELYAQVASRLEAEGNKVLKGKSPNEALTHIEFVRLMYAFSGQPKGKSLYEQKRYLKQAQLIESADIGITTGLDGEVRQYHLGQNQGEKIALAAPVFMQDRIETDIEAAISFTFDDGSEMTLGEDVVIEITEHIYDPDKDLRKTIVKLSEGIVRFAVTKGKALGSKFEVITPMATAGVRGTEFVVMVEPGGKTTFVGIEGYVETKLHRGLGNSRNQLIGPGQMQGVSKVGSSKGVESAPRALIKSAIMKTKPKQTLPAKAAALRQANFSKAMAHFAEVKQGKNGKKSKTMMKAQGNPKKDAGSDGASGALAGGMGVGKKMSKEVSKQAAKGQSKVAAKNAAKKMSKENAKSSERDTAKQVSQAVANKNKGNPKAKTGNNGKALGKGKGKGKGKP